MAIREELVLDLTKALNQLDDLERQLDGLLQPIEIPVQIETSQALDQLERDIRQVDNTDIDVDVDVTGVETADKEFEQLNREIAQTDDELEEIARQADRTGRELQETGRRGQTGFAALTTGVALLTAGIAAFRGADSLFRFFGDSIAAASDLEESLSKTRVVFGEFSGDIEAFASTAPQALGLANSAALEFSGTFGNLFVALGLSQEAAADLAPEIVQLGADLASFNNIEVTDALDKLRAGLVGEAEPLRVLGVNLTAATVSAKALELGLADSTGEVSEAAKVQARYALILEQTATAQGDFARTADGIANRQRTLAAEFENLKTSVGEALLPAFEALVALGPSIIALIEAMTPAARNAAEGFADFVAEIEPFLLRTTQITQVTGALGDVFTAARTPILQTGEALGKLLSGDISGAIGEIGELGDTLGELQDRAQIRGITIGIAEALLNGADAVQVFDAALEGALKQTELTEEAFDQLATTAGISDLEILRASEAILTLGESAGLSADEIILLQNKITDLRNDQRGGDIEALRFQNLQEQAEALNQTAEAAINEATALDILSVAADEAGVSLGELLSNTEDLPPEMAALVDTLDQGTIDFLASMERLEEVREVIGTLPGAMQAAGAALRDEENEIVEDFSEFFDNLLEELEAREAFESNLAILRALGLDGLAEVFDSAGLEAAAALADAVANPQEAADAEAALDGEYAGVALSVVDTMRETIEGLPVTQALIDNLITAAQLADTPEVRAALLALADALSLEIPVSFGTPTNLPTFTEGIGGGLVPTSSINSTVNINSPGVTDTDIARTEQAVSAAIAAGAQ